MGNEPFGFGGILTRAKLNRTMLRWEQGTRLPLGWGQGRGRMQHSGKNQLLRGCSFNLPHLLHLVPQSCSKTEQATAGPVCFPTCKLKMQKKILNSSCALIVPCSGLFCYWLYFILVSSWVFKPCVITLQAKKSVFP